MIPSAAAQGIVVGSIILLASGCMTYRRRASAMSPSPAMLKAYDPDVLGQFAQRLLRRADSIIVLYAVFGLATGGLAFIVAAPVDNPGFGVAVAALAFFIFLALGYERAFAFRVQAQTVLCQVAIEMNTRQMVITTQMQATRQQY